MSEATDFGTFGRFEETAVGDMPADMKEAYDFTIKLRGLVPGPHRIWLANPELSKTVVPIGAYYQAGYSPCMRAVRHGVGRGAGTKRPGSVRRRADTQVWQAAAGLPRRLLRRLSLEGSSDIIDVASAPDHADTRPGAQAAARTDSGAKTP